jgi:hypothetical protein
MLSLEREHDYLFVFNENIFDYRMNSLSLKTPLFDLAITT